ncbi:MAG: hypothetical protein EOO60_04400 [Hymenobacter sp.]|nr:MAG: hypothetical protein EOO60_04400 [Hymenobacter sp.]
MPFLLKLRPLRKSYIDKNFSNPDNHIKGLWTTQDLSANHKGPHFPITNKKTGEVYYPSEGRYWVFNEVEVLKRIDDGRIIFGKSGNSSPVQRVFLSDKGSKRMKAESWWDKHGMNEDATAQLKELFAIPKIFDHTKPVQTLQHLVNIASNLKDNDLILDFFAGSGTTGHAVMAQNAADNGNRRFILVQLPESLDPNNKDQKTAADFCDSLGKPRNIAELTKERLRRAAHKVRANKPEFKGDQGFRVYKLDSTNVRPWDPNPKDIAGSLFASQEHLKDDRTEQDILTELLLKLGLPLTGLLEERSVGGHTLYAVGAGTLLACLSPRIEKEEVETLAQALATWHQELAPVGDSQVVLRDSAFRTDVAKTNFTAILEQAGFDRRNIRSL